MRFFQFFFFIHAVSSLTMDGDQSHLALPPHPRLILTPSRLVDVKAFILNNTQASAYYTFLLAQGEYVLNTKPLPRPPQNSSDILMAARSVLTRIYVTSLLWRLTSNETYANRAIAELLEIISWQDWDIQKHALDAGELCHAAAIGFDWCYSVATPEQRSSIVAGIIEKGLIPFQQAYIQGGGGNTWWTSDSSNWAIVTNGGAGIAALSLLGEAGTPNWLQALLNNATRGVVSSASPSSSDRGPNDSTGGGYSPEGAWWEGPIYHGYASRYFVPFASSVESSSGDSSLWLLPGVSKTSSYQMHVLDSSYNYHNWADAETGQETLAMLLTVAERAQDKAAAYTLRSRLDFVANNITVSSIDIGDQRCMEFAQALIYFTATGSKTDREALSLDIAMPAKKLAILRSSWTDPQAIFVGAKGCNCSWNHGDLDSGSFVFSSKGQRFISDLGPDNYALPDYFGGKRFDYYRKNSKGHNVLSFGGNLHDAVDCFASDKTSATTTFLTGFNSTSSIVTPSPPGHDLLECEFDENTEANCLVIDLTSAFSRQGVSSASRRFALSADRTTLLLSDRWTLSAADLIINATASFHTYASVTLAGDLRSATLVLNGESISLRLPSGGVCSTSARFETTNVKLLPPQYSSTGLVRIDLVIDSANTCSGFDIEIG
jgi:hypothetical protein